MRGMSVVAALSLGWLSCAPPCVPFSRAAHEVRCAEDGGRALVATLYAQNDTVLSPSCAAALDGGVVVATVSGVVCPGEQFERLATFVSVECALPALEDGAVPVHEGAIELHTDGGVTTCAAR